MLSYQPELAASAADVAVRLSRRKEELADLVSAFLIKEPRFQNTGTAGGFDDTGLPISASSRLAEGAAKKVQGREEAQPSAKEAATLHDGNESSSSRSSASSTHSKGGAANLPDRVSVPAPRDEDNGATDQVERLRALVHDISLHDGEFCLKAALYVRHELNIRQTANFLCALCAREAACQPFLACYLPKIIVLPSDWLAVANFAYYFDNDYEHCKWDLGRRRERAKRRRERLQRHKARALRDLESMGQRRGVQRGLDTQSSSSPQGREKPSAAELAEQARLEEERQEVALLKRRYLPQCLRRTLVETFAPFSEFSLAKYNNEGAEKKKRRAARMKERARLLSLEVLPDSEGSSSDEEEDNNDGSSDGDSTGREADVPKPQGYTCTTFTYKRLIRLLHISEPAYEVCCLLGKRYPETKEEFDRLFNPSRTAQEEEKTGNWRDGVRVPQQQQQQRSSAVKRREFDPSMAGKRMRLAIPTTWETQLAAEGNIGVVWDSLVERNELPFMATLRNLRNVLTRNCAPETHDAIMARLTSEEQVSRSKQLPYRFFSAYTAAAEAYADLEATSAWVAKREGLRAELLRQRPRQSRAEIDKEVRQRVPFPRKKGREGVKRCELPILKTLEQQRTLVHQYKETLNTSVAIATRLNVIPMPGVSLVVLTLSYGMLENVRAAGGGGVASVRTKLDVAALLAVMMMHACESCILVICAYDEFLVYDSADSPTDGSHEENTAMESHDNPQQRGRHSNGAHKRQRKGNPHSAAAAPDGDASVLPPSATQSAILTEVEALTRVCQRMLHQKAEASTPTARGKTKSLFSPWRARPAPGAAVFPFPLLDQLIERRTELAALMTIDDDGHHTYADMNPMAPALGDLPAYLARLRRASSPNLVYVGVAVGPPSKASVRGDDIPNIPCEPLPETFDVMAESRAAKAAFAHRNDILLTGFSDAILRLVAERTRGGTVAAIEQADATYKVNRSLARSVRLSAEEHRRTLSWLRHVEVESEKNAQAHTTSPRTTSAEPGAPGVSQAVTTGALPAAASGASGKPAVLSVSPPKALTAMEELKRMGEETRQARVHFTLPPSSSVAGSLPSRSAEAAHVPDGGEMESARAVAPPASHHTHLRDALLSLVSGGLGGAEFARELAEDDDCGTRDNTDGATTSPYDGSRFRSKLLVDPIGFSSPSGATATTTTLPGTLRSPPPSCTTLPSTTILLGGLSAYDNESEGAGSAATARDASPDGAGAARGKRVPLTIYHPTPFISLSQVAGGDEGAMTLKYALKYIAKHRKHAAAAPATAVAGGNGKQTASTTTTAAAPKESFGSSHGTPHEEGVEREKKPSSHADHEETGRYGVSETPTRSQRSTSVQAEARAAHSSPSMGYRPLTPVRPFRECRFFISSTFLDMNNERNALTLDVFPRLRRWAAESGIKVRIIEVDLRWGITEVSTNENLSTSVCLNEVSRCAPFFLGMLGSRYGSCPSPLQIVADEDIALDDYAWLTEIPPEMDGAISVTELEMRHGIYTAQERWRRLRQQAQSQSTPVRSPSVRVGSARQSKRGRSSSASRDDAETDRALLPDTRATLVPPSVLFFHRHDDTLHQSLPNDDRKKVYEADTATTRARIARLEAYIRDRGIPIVEYKATYLDPSARCLSGATGDPSPAAQTHDKTRATVSTGGVDSNRGSALSALAATVGSAVASMPTHPWSSSRAVTTSVAFTSATSGAFPGLPSLPALHYGDSSSLTTSADGIRRGAMGAQAYSSEGRFLTSQDVLLNMEDFSAKAFTALQQTILRSCVNPPSSLFTVDEPGTSESPALSSVAPVGKEADTSNSAQELSLGSHESDTGSDGVTPTTTSLTTTAVALDASLAKTSSVRSALGTSPLTTSLTTTARQVTGSLQNQAADFYTTHVLDAARYAADLCKLYVPPKGFLADLVNAALGVAATMHHPEKAGDTEAGLHNRGQHRLSAATGGPASSHSGNPAWRLTTTSGDGAGAVAAMQAGLDVVSDADGDGGVVVVEASDGDGKSSALAMLFRYLSDRRRSLSPTSAEGAVVYCARQASDGSLRSLLLFTAMSLILQCHLQDSFQISEKESTAELLEVLPKVYDAVKKEGKSAVVLLDGLEQSPEADEIVKHLGTIVNPLASPDIRFVLSSAPLSPITLALQARVPPARTLSLPSLDWAERAEVVRRHLASYGKRLQESAIEVDELKGLLRKRGAARPSYLTAALTYLRLFSTFDTLRDDIRQLPSATAQVYVQFLRELELRFDEETCRLLLTTLFLRQAFGGITEYNLYRLISHVAVASRLVTLLTGTCIVMVGDRLLLNGAFFTSAILQMYLRSHLERREASERMLAAEILYLPLTAFDARPVVSQDSFDETAALPGDEEARKPSESEGLVPVRPVAAAAVDSKAALRAALESIRASANDPSAPCVFQPARYAPRELLSLLSGALQAERTDVATELVCYLPFLEHLLKNPAMLQRLIGLLSQLLRMSTNARMLARVESAMGFLQRHYHILCVRPDLIGQCRLNASSSAYAISRYTSTVMVACLSGSLEMSPKEGTPSPSVPDRAAGTEESPVAAEKVAHTCQSWVRWNNVEQHGGASRLFAASPTLSPIVCMATSPDGAFVALGCQDHHLRIAPCDAPEHIRMSLKHAAAVTAVSFVNSRGQRMATATSTEVYTEDTRDPSPLGLGREKFYPTAADHRAADRSAMGNRGRNRPEPLQRDASSGNELPVRSPDRDAPLGSPEVSQSRTYKDKELSTGDDSNAKAWRGTADAQQPRQTLHPTRSSPKKSVRKAASTAEKPRNESVVVSGCERGLFYVWSLEDGTLLQVGAAHLRAITAITCHPIENVVCTTGLDGYCVLWNILGRESNLAGHLTGFLHEALQSCEKALQAAQQKHQKRRRMPRGQAAKSTSGLSREQQQEKLNREKAIHEQSLKSSINLLKNFTKTPGASLSRHALTGLGGTQSTLSAFGVLRHADTPIAAAAFHQAGEVLATGTWDGTVTLLHLTHFMPIAALQAVDTDDRKEPTTDMGPLRVPYESQTFHVGASVRALCFAPSKIVTCAVGTADGVLTLIDQASGLVSARLTHLHTSPITALTYDPDGVLMASADDHGVIKVAYAGVTGTEMCALSGHRQAVTGLCFNPRVTRSATNTAATLTAVSTDAFSDPPTTLLSASTDLTVQAWSVKPDDAAPTSTFSWAGHDDGSRGGTAPRQALRNAHTTTVTCVAAASDGTCFVTGCADGSAMVFRVSVEDEDRVASMGSAAVKKQRRRTGVTTSARGEMGLTETDVEDGLPYDPNTCLQPAFMLSHSGGRVTCLRFALQNTRILAGVAFGYVYVWSSTPDASRRQGRLLQRVRVPPQGLFSVVSLEAHNLEDTLRRLRTSRGGREHNGKHTEPGFLRRAGYDEEGDSTEFAAPCCAQVTAVCSSGDTAVFCVYADTVSVTRLRQAYQRQRQEQLALSSSSLQDESPAILSAGGSTTDGSDNASAFPSRTPSPPRHAASEAQHRRVSTLMAMDVEQQFRNLERGRPVSMREGLDFPVVRERITWLVRSAPRARSGTTAKPHQNANPVEWESTAGHEVVTVMPLFFCCEARRAAKKAYESGFGQGTSRPPLELDWAEKGVFASDSVRVDKTAWEGDEDDLCEGVYPASSRPPASAFDPVMDLVNRAVTEAPHTTLRTVCHESIVVSRRGLYCLNHRTRRAHAIEVTLHPELVYRADVFATEFSLASEEVFTCASSLVPYGLNRNTLPSLNRGTSSGEGGSTAELGFWALFTAATSEGRLLVFHVRRDHGAEEDGLHVQLVFTSFLFSNRAGGGKLTVDSLDLSLSRAAGVANHAEARLLVGCGDATVRVMTLTMDPSLAQQANVRMSPKSHRGDVDTNRQAFTAHALAQPSSQPVPWTLQEENVFYAAAPLTALSVLVPSPQRSLFCFSTQPRAGTNNNTAESLSQASKNGSGAPPKRTLSSLTGNRDANHDDSDDVRPPSLLHTHLLRKATLSPATPVHESEDAATRQPPREQATPLFWVAGDTLGNLYQLRLEREEEFVARLTASAANKRASIGFGARGWLLKNALAEGEPLPLWDVKTDASVAGRDEGPQDDSGDRPTKMLDGWAWHATSAFEWLRPVDFTRQPLPAPMAPLSFDARRSQAGRSDEPPSVACVKASTLNEELFLSQKRNAVADAENDMWKRGFVRTDSTIVPPSLHDTFHQLDALQARAQPEPLASFYTERDVDAYMHKEFPTLTSASKSSPVYCKRRGKGPSTADLPNGKADPNSCAAKDVSAAQQLESVTEDGAAQGSPPAPAPSASYFSILTMAGPPSTVRGHAEDRKAWVRRQQDVLKEALRVQHYNAEARAALESYNRRMLTQARLLE